MSLKYLCALLLPASLEEELKLNFLSWFQPLSYTTVHFSCVEDKSDNLIYVKDLYMYLHNFSAKPHIHLILDSSRTLRNRPRKYFTVKGLAWPRLFLSQILSIKHTLLYVTTQRNYDISRHRWGDTKEVIPINSYFSFKRIVETLRDGKTTVKF